MRALRLAFLDWRGDKSIVRAKESIMKRLRVSSIVVGGLVLLSICLFVALGPIIVMPLATGPSSIAAPSLDGPYLFTDTAIEEDLDTAGDPTIIRTRFVSVNFDLLGGADTLPGDLSDGGDVAVLNLFDDVVFTAILNRVEPNRSGGYSWLGHLEGVEYSQVILVVKNGLMAGNITLPKVFYQVRYAGSGVHAIYEINQSAFSPDAEPISVDTPDGGEAPDTAMADDGSIIDVLVVYTGAARSAAGGTTAMETLINLAVAETNQSYANSGITQRLNLVHTAEVSYSESDFDWSITLSRLRGTSDGYMDNVHTLRDTYCADEVVLIVNSGGYCGLAYMMTYVSHGFNTWAFAVVARGCATGYYSFGHELGHNMGARHDWYVDDGTVPYGYAHGYVNATYRWRTIMAYNTECSDGGSYCQRLQYWSNPDVNYGDAPMGVPEGQYHPADNRKTLNNTAYTAANWRASCTAPCTDPPTIPHCPSPTDGAVDVSISTDLTWSGGHPCPGESVAYDVYLEANDSTPDSLICDDVLSPLCDPGTLSYDTHYYWQVVASGLNGPSPGPVWDFYTGGAAQILLVDDDLGVSYETYYQNALSANGYSFDNWEIDTQGFPMLSTLQNHNVVIWATGDDPSATLTDTDQANLQAYLDGGGNLFVSGQDIGFDLTQDGSIGNTFFADYLHASYVQDDVNLDGLNGVSGDPISDGLSLTISWGDGADNQAFPSEIDPLSPAVTVLTYEQLSAPPSATSPEATQKRERSEPKDSQKVGIQGISSSGSGAIRACTETYKVVYFAFGFEAINSAADRNTVMDKVVGWLSSCGHPSCFGDFDCDCDVDVADILQVASRWRMTDEDPDWEAPYDLDGNGIITIVDIMLVVTHWGETCNQAATPGSSSLRLTTSQAN